MLSLPAAFSNSTSPDIETRMCFFVFLCDISHAREGEKLTISRQVSAVHISHKMLPVSLIYFVFPVGDSQEIKLMSNAAIPSLCMNVRQERE